MKGDGRPIDVVAFEPSGAGLVCRLLARLGIDARAIQDLAGRSPEGRVVVCLDNPLPTARSRAARAGMSLDDALGEWEDHHRELREQAPRPRRLVVHYDSLLHDAQAEVGRLATWLGARVSRELLDASAAEVKGLLRAQSATAEELMGSEASESLIGLYLDLCAEAGPVYHRALAAEVGRELVGVLGPTQRDGHGAEQGVPELMARLQAELTVGSRSSRLRSELEGDPPDDPPVGDLAEVDVELAVGIGVLQIAEVTHVRAEAHVPIRVAGELGGGGELDFEAEAPVAQEAERPAVGPAQSLTSPSPSGGSRRGG